MYKNEKYINSNKTLLLILDIYGTSRDALNRFSTNT